VNLLLDPALEHDWSRDRKRMEEELRECDRRVKRYRALLDGGVEPDLVAGWLKEVAAARRVIEHKLTELENRYAETVDRENVRKVLEDLAGLTGLSQDSQDC
jgi:hypothetical protein